MRRVKVRALLVITRVDSRWVPFLVDVFVQRCSQDPATLDLAEDFSCCGAECLPLPSPAYKLKVGETLRIDARCTFTYSVDYFGEGDVDLEWDHYRVLRKQRARETYFKSGERHGTSRR